MVLWQLNLESARTGIHGVCYLTDMLFYILLFPIVVLRYLVASCLMESILLHPFLWKDLVSEISQNIHL